jgi:hypothetical protein
MVVSPEIWRGIEINENENQVSLSFFFLGLTEGTVTKGM